MSYRDQVRRCAVTVGPARRGESLCGAVQLEIGLTLAVFTQQSRPANAETYGDRLRCRLAGKMPGNGDTQ